MTTLAFILLGSGVTFIWTAATNRDIRAVVRSVVRGEPMPEPRTSAVQDSASAQPPGSRPGDLGIWRGTGIEGALGAPRSNVEDQIRQSGRGVG